MKNRRMLIIDNSIGDFYPAAKRLPPEGFSMPCDTVNLFAGDKAPELSAYSHIIATGCTKSICNIEGWMLKLQELFAEALERDIALLAICFSHQLLARLIAGEEYVRRRESPELGWAEHRLLENDPLLGRRGERIWGFVSHFDEVCAGLPPDKATVLMSSKDCAVSAFRVKGKNAWGIQPHFEESIESGTELLMRQCEIDAALKDVIMNEDKPRDSGFWPILLERFENIGEDKA